MIYIFFDIKWVKPIRAVGGHRGSSGAVGGRWGPLRCRRRPSGAVGGSLEPSGGYKVNNSPVVIIRNIRILDSLDIRKYPDEKSDSLHWDRFKKKLLYIIVLYCPLMIQTAVFKFKDSGTLERFYTCSLVLVIACFLTYIFKHKGWGFKI